MRCSVSDVDCGVDSERPEEIFEIAVNEHGAYHVLVGLICSFGDAVLTGSIWDGLLVSDSVRLHVLLELTFNVFRGVVHAKNFDFRMMKTFDLCLELDEMS